jgi:predicted dienelactone hydrolase
MAALALASSLAACGSSGSDGSKNKGPTTTLTPDRAGNPKAEAKYAGDGPNPVGSYTTALGDGRRVVVWYPAVKAAAKDPDEIFDIASLLSPKLQAQIKPELRPQYHIAAHVGAKAADGQFPIVLFSHGYAGFPEQSADLVTHLASWGFVVVAPDHVERSLSGLLGTAAQNVPKQTDPVVLSEALDTVIRDAQRGDSPLKGKLDTTKVAVTGHSAGAEAAYTEATADERIKAFISYSVGLGGEDGKAAIPPVPKVPGMIMLGTKDGIIPPAETRKVFEGMDAPKYLVEIGDAGHLVFSDICEIGKDQGGLVALVHEAGLDIPDTLLKLASDGCEKDRLEPTKAFAAIDHLSVAFLRYELGIDKEPIGLDPAVTKAFDTADVKLTADPK